VLGLKVVVQTLKSAGGGGASPRAARELEEERSKLREAQLHADGLKRSFDALLSEMERLRSDASAAVGEAGAPRAPELLRPASAAGEPSRAVAVARCVLMGYSAAQAEGALAELGRNDAAAAVALLKSLGANAEADPPTAARLGAASRTYSPYPVGPVTFPKGRPPAAAGAAAWPGAARARAGVRGDLFRARRRAADMLVALTGRGFAEALGDSEAARGFCLRALGGAKMLATRAVPARLLLRAGGLEAASAVMAVYRRDGPIVCAAAAVLRELAANDFSAAAVASSPKLPAALLAAVAALKSNPGHIAVGVHCAALLWSLCSLGGRRAQSLALDASAPPLLYKLLTEHAEQRELVWRATGALLAMALHNAETQAALSRQGAQIYVREALARDPTLQYGGEFSELRLWMRAQVVLPPPPAAEEPDLAEPGAVGRDSNPRGRPAARRRAAAAAAARASGGGGWAPSASLAEAWEAEAEEEGEGEEAEAEGDGYYAVATRGGGYVQPLSRRALAGPERVAAAAAAAAAASRAGSVAGSLRGSGRNTPLRGAEEEALLASAPERYAYAAAAAGVGAGALPRPQPGYMWEVDELGPAADGPGSLAQLLPSAYAPLTTTQPLPLSPYPARPFTAAEGELVDPSYERERAATKAASRARSQASTPARRASPAPGGEEPPADSPAAARAAQRAAEAAASAAAAAEAEALAEQLEYRAADEAVRSELQGQVSAVSRRAAEAEARARAAEARAVAAEARAAELEASAAAEARAAAAEERAAVAEALAAELRRQRAAAAAEAAAEAAARRSAGARAAAAAAEAEAEASAAQEAAEAAERRSAAAVAACAAAKARLEQRSHDVSLAEVQRSVAAQAAREAALGARGDDESPLPAAAPSSAGDSRPTTPEAAALQAALALLLAPAPPPAQALSSALRGAARAVASPAAARSLLSAGGVPALVRCLAARGAAEPALAADACLLLGVLTQETEVGPACRAEGGPCADGSAARALVSVLRSHPATVALQATAAWALWGLLRLDEEDGGGAEAQAAAAAEAGAAGALADALRAHPASPEVAQSAAGGLLALAAAGGEAGKAAVSAVGGVALVRQAAQRHSSLTFRGEFDGLRGWLKSEAKKAAKRS